MVNLTTEHDVDRFEKQVIRKVPLTEREQEKERLEKEKQDYIQEHGRLQYYYHTWTGGLNTTEEQQQLEEDEKEESAGQQITGDHLSLKNISHGEQDEHSHGMIDEDQPHHGLTTDEQRALTEKRIRDRKGFLKYYWGKLRGTPHVDEDADLFVDNPSDDEFQPEAAETRKKRTKYAKLQYYERFPLRVDDIRLCDPKLIMLDHPQFFNHVPGYNIDSETYISWPFDESYGEVPIIENRRKTQVHTPALLDDLLPASEEPKADELTGHLFLDELPRDCLPKRNAQFMEF